MEIKGTISILHILLLFTLLRSQESGFLLPCEAVLMCLWGTLTFPVYGTSDNTHLQCQECF